MPDRFGRLTPRERAANQRYLERQEERDYRRRQQEEDRALRLQRQQEDDEWRRITRERQLQEWNRADQEKIEKARQRQVKEAQRQAQARATRSSQQGIIGAGLGSFGEYVSRGLSPEQRGGVAAIAEPLLENRLRMIQDRPTERELAKERFQQEGLRASRSRAEAREERAISKAIAAEEKARNEAEIRNARQTIDYNKRLRGNTEKELSKMGSWTTQDVVDETGLRKVRVWVPTADREGQTFEDAEREARAVAAGYTRKVPGVAVPRPVISEAPVAETIAPGVGEQVSPEVAGGEGFSPEAPAPMVPDFILQRMQVDPGFRDRRMNQLEAIALTNGHPDQAEAAAILRSLEGQFNGAP